MDEINKRLDNIASLIITLGKLFQEEIGLVKAEQRELTKQIERVAYYASRIEEKYLDVKGCNDRRRKET